MSGRPASVRARDCKQVIIGAKRAGAKRVEFKIGAVTINVPLNETSAEADPESNNSFDKIMRKPEPA